MKKIVKKQPTLERSFKENPASEVIEAVAINSLWLPDTPAIMYPLNT